jgi:hypothetical protein
MIHTDYSSATSSPCLDVWRPQLVGGAVGFVDQDEWEHTISVRPNSDVSVEITEPTDLRGMMNSGATPSVRDSDRCEFWINNHWIGDLSSTHSMTPWIHLPPGIYRLRMKPARSSAETGPCWIARKGKHRSTGRLALITVGCYPETQLKQRLFWLHRSAARFGLLVHTFGISTAYGCHYEAKIERMAQWLKELPSCYDKVLFMDGRDTFLVGGEAEIVSRLNASVLISAESVCVPDSRPEWSALFGSDMDQIYPNAGMWAGIRLNIEECLERLQDFNRCCLAGFRVGLLTSTKHFDNDQHLWQAFMIYGDKPIATDTRMTLFCTLGDFPANAEGKSPVQLLGAELVTKYETRPVCMHFPGSSTDKLEYWAGHLLGECQPAEAFLDP